MSGEVWRYTLPIDDGWHTLHLSGRVLHVAQRIAHPGDLERVELWVLHTDGPEVPREFRVYGTGQPIGGGDQGLTVEYVGTVLAPPEGLLVWHVFERVSRRVD